MIERPFLTQDEAGCCVQLYSHPLVQALLGESFHLGGLALTGDLGRRLELSPSDRVLDVGAGLGRSAICLAETFGCRVPGFTLAENLVAAGRAARRSTLGEGHRAPSGGAPGRAVPEQPREACGRGERPARRQQPARPLWRELVYRERLEPEGAPRDEHADPRRGRDVDGLGGDGGGGALARGIAAAGRLADRRLARRRSG